MSKKHSVVPVDLGALSYEVLIGSGLLAGLPAMLRDRFGAVKCGIVTDTAVAAHHLAPLEAELKSSGVHAGTVVVPSGESSKSFGQLASLCEALLAMGLERRDIVLALGGGVIGDLTGFAASIIRRGIRFVTSDNHSHSSGLMLKTSSI